MPHIRLRSHTYIKEFSMNKRYVSESFYLVISLIPADTLGQNVLLLLSPVSNSQGLLRVFSFALKTITAHPGDFLKTKTQRPLIF